MKRRRKKGRPKSVTADIWGKGTVGGSATKIMRNKMLKSQSKVTGLSLYNSTHTR